MMRNKMVKLLGSCILTLLVGCQYNREPKPMQVVAHVQKQVFNVTNGITDEYINARQNEYDQYRSKPINNLPEEELVELRRDVKGRNWGEFQNYVVVGDGTRFQKCEFAKRWYLKHEDQIVRIAYQTNKKQAWAFVLIQDESLYEKEITDDNGLSDYIFKVEYAVRIKKLKPVLSITDCTILLKQDVV
jgi:hypothetical protein